MIRRQRIIFYFPNMGSLTAGMHFFIDREHSFTPNGEGWYVAKSKLLVCPKCRRIWAVLEFDDDELVWPVAQSCEECNIRDEWMPVPGSILEEEGRGVIDTALLNALPEDEVRREFNLHLKAYQETRP